MIKKILKNIMLLLLVNNFLFSFQTEIKGQNIFSDNFHNIYDWKPIFSDGVKLDIRSVVIKKIPSIELNIDFSGKMGYVVISKDVSMVLQNNFKISFLVSGNIPDNNLELKLVDKYGNVFWKKWENYQFKDDWELMTVERDDIEFAWGPDPNSILSEVAKIEFAVSSGNSGAGKVFIADLNIKFLESQMAKFKNIKVTASSEETPDLNPKNAIDGNRKTRWSSKHEDNQWLLIDLGLETEISGLVIDWEVAYAKSYEILISKDGIKWEKVFYTNDSDGGVDDIFIEIKSARYIKINGLERATGWGISIYEIMVKGKEEAATITASSAQDGKIFANLMDGIKTTFWKSSKEENQYIQIDFKKSRGYSGIFIYWDEDNYAREYEVIISDDAKLWEKVFSTKFGNGGLDKIYLENIASRYLRINMKKSNKNSGYQISRIEIKSSREKVTPIKKFEVLAEESPIGFYPKYMLNKQSYWTVIGVNGDDKEALINEQGMFEVDRENFSIEPFLFFNRKLFTWADVKISQELEKDYLPIPIVKWDSKDFTLTSKFFAVGNINESVAVGWYKIKNNTTKKLSGKFFLAIRPFQVNPPWQTLNTIGGLAKIKMISYDNKIVNVNNEKTIIPITKPNNFGATIFQNADIINYLKEGKVPTNNMVKDDSNFASAALEYLVELNANEEKDVFIAVPFHKSYSNFKPNLSDLEAKNIIMTKLEENISYWDSKVNFFDIKISSKEMKLVNTIRSNLAYILINKDGPRIQPGSRSYNRSWIRDGALTSSALLKMGLIAEVKEFIDWYSKFIFQNGHVPCVVDNRGADGVPEHDSHGQYIYLCMQYYHYTRDKKFLEKNMDNIIKVADYIIFLRNQRKKDEYKKGSDEKRSFYGLVPESISHEGYSAKPMHSYWDNFFALKGLKDAAKIMEILGRIDLQKKYANEVKDYRKDLYNSITLAMDIKGINYIPGCAELGDFDATSTSIGIYPCDEFEYIPRQALLNTFNRYYDDVKRRFIPGVNWGENYTPYETRNIRSFIYLGQKERAHKILDYFFTSQRPYNWNHWAEIVWREYEKPRFIGDMPHTWVGSDYINSVRSLFVIENENLGNMTLFKGIKDDWLDYQDGISVKNLPTIWGKINFEIKKGDKNTVVIKISGDVRPPRGFIVYSPLSKPIKEVKVDGKVWKKFTEQEVILKNIAEKIEIKY